MADEIDKLSVTLEANAADLINDTNAAVKRIERQLQQMGDRGEKSFDQTGKSAKRLGLEIGVISGLVSALTQSLIQMASRAGQFFVDAGKKAIGMRAAAETAQTVFENMFGDRQAAIAFLEQLRQKAADLKVPFSAASQFAKSILPDTGSVEEFNEILRLASIGAKDARLPLEELIFSFNEALSGDFTSIRDRLDIPRDVIARIREADDVSAALTEELNKLFTKRGINNAAAFDDTLAGIVANLQVFADDILFIASQPGFEALKDAAQRFQDVLSENRPQIEAIAAAFGELVGQAINFVSTKVIDAIENIDTEATLELVDSMGSAFESAQLLADVISDLSFNDLIDGANKLVEAFQKALVTAAQIETIAGAQQASQDAQERQAAIEFGFDPDNALSRASASLGRFFLDAEAQARIAAAGEKAYQQTVLDALPAFDKYSQKQEERKNKTEEVVKATGSDADALDLVNQKLGENSSKLAEVTEKQNELLQKLGADMLDAQDKINDQLEQNQEEHAQTMLEIDAQEKAERADINAKFDEQLASERKEILSDARQDLKDLERETDKALADERKSFHIQERRDTEDHIRRLRDLRLGLLDSLEDAVKNRDARAIVDARRRFEREQQQQVETFQVSQAREREDKDRRLAEIEAEERERADKIIQQREQQLQELLVQNETNRQKELEQLEADFAQRREKEQTSFDEKQALLEGQMERELEAIAKSLAQQADVTEEGAAKILGKLSDVFGVDGSIDKLMETYRKRISDLGDLKINIDVEEGAPSSSNSLPTQQASKGFAVKGGAFQHGTGGPRLFSKPTAAIFAERSPEVVNITPLSQLGKMGDMGAKEVDLNVKLSGSAPPGITTGQDLDAMAGVIVSGFRAAGFRAKS